MASSSFLSPPSPFISSPKFTHSPPPSSVTFRLSNRVSASYSSYAAEGTTSTSSSMYEVLGLSMGASGQEIKAAYRKLARVSHPDVIGRQNDSASSTADEFIRIHDAYATLSDPGRRAEYDRTLFPRQRGPTVMRAAGASRYSGYTMGRNWETDQCW